MSLNDLKANATETLELHLEMGAFFSYVFNFNGWVFLAPDLHPQTCHILGPFQAVYRLDSHPDKSLEK